MTAQRRRPQPRQRIVRQKATIGSGAGRVSIYLDCGELDDGTLGELFLRTNSGDGDLQSVLNAVAISVSIGLQHGTPLAAYVDAFVFTKWELGGMVTGVEEVKMCTSPLDLVFRLLAIWYLGRDDLRSDGGLLP